ncbi:MAG: hypothetical protein WCD31_09825, partial [Gillisia sp.]
QGITPTVQMPESRMYDLRNAIAWSFENGGLTAGQRTCLHQQIAQMLHYGDEAAPLRPELEQKVQHILRVIKDTGWEKQEVKY